MRYRSAKRILAALLVLSAVFAVCGCTDSRHYEAVEKKALQFYQEKYGKTDVTVVKSYAAGTGGLFGMLGVEDRAYEMSDGFSIYWDDDAETFADNAQAKEILSDLDREILQPLLAEFSFPLKASSPSLNRTGYESYDECVFTLYYDGDIHSYLLESRPKMRDFRVTVETLDQEVCERQVGAFFDGLKEYVSGWGEVYVFSSGLDGFVEDGGYLDPRAMNVTARASLDFDEEISWYRKIFIEVCDGIRMTSSKADFDLEEGDVRFEQIGTCADLQQMIDDAYYAMPVDAEENKNGGYTVKDQRHEVHIVLDDPDAPLYGLVLSQRVLDALDERKCLSVYILDSREDGGPLMMYYGEDSKVAYSVYRVCERGDERAAYGSISPGYLYYFGTHTMHKYGE